MAVVLMAMVAAGTPAQAAPGDDPGPLTTITSASDLAKLTLTQHQVLPTTISKLGTHLDSVGVDEVLQSANHTMRNRSACRATETGALPVQPAASNAYCWDTGDDTTREFLPQGLTSSGDADDDGMWGTNKVIISAWAHNDSHDYSWPEEDGHLARFAFIDANNSSAFKYRWVLPVIPTEGGDNFAKFGSHVGGVVWFGDKLLVTAYNTDGSHNALYVFSMAHILQASVNAHEIGKVSGGYSAHGYQYIMPAIGSYSLDADCDPNTSDNLPCFASITLDRTTSPPTIVANEWFSSGGSTPARIFRYKLAAPGGEMPLVTSGDKATTSAAFRTKAVGLQSVLAHDNVFYANDARGGRGQHGILWQLRNSTTTWRGCSGTDSEKACWAQHAEGASLWWSTQQMWSQTEWAADADSHWIGDPIPERVLFSVPLNGF
ncbi:hypothetical protein ACIQI8_30765 [Streptomyces sp. NPDC092369]|uniref:hypothetical protein n=1 Tax=Streptomyces sp. NPDC092369 TaxID=3366015 RepID=UPI0038263B99